MRETAHSKRALAQGRILNGFVHTSKRDREASVPFLLLPGLANRPQQPSRCLSLLTVLLQV
jgi:hypothetical protein